jgi:hypothetical protein
MSNHRHRYSKKFLIKILLFDNLIITLDATVSDSDGKYSLTENVKTYLVRAQKQRSIQQKNKKKSQ